METILGLLGVIAVYAIGAIILRGLGAGARAAVRSATGKGSFGANFGAAFAGMAPMVTRLRSEQVSGEHPFVVYHIEVKGLFPVTVPQQLTFVASILDVTERGPNGRPMPFPVLCMVDRFQEPETTAYGDRADVGEVEPDYGFVDWVPILHFIPETLVPPRSGERTFKVFVTAFDPMAAPSIRLGFIEGGKPLAAWSHDFTWDVQNEGYREKSEKQTLAEEGIIRLAVAVAFADGHMKDPEGGVIKSWMSERLELLDSEDRQARRKRFNAVLQHAFSEARAGSLAVSGVVEELEECASPAARAAAVELCLDVMAADGHAGDDELKMVNTIAKRLEVDLERFESLKDKRLVGVASKIGGDVDYYALLNIDRTWNQDQVRTHLNKLYAQWNSRAEALTDPEQRAQAEHMLEVIARARQRLLQ